MGELIREGQKNGTVDDGRRGQPKSGRHDTVSCLTLTEFFNLDCKDKARQKSSRAQKLVDIPKKKIEAFVEKQQEAGEEVEKTDDDTTDTI